MDNFKESWGKMSKRNKVTLIGIVVATVIVAAAAIIYLSLNSKTKYSTLFTGLSTEEASQVAGLLQDQDIAYTYNANDGSIRVPEDKVESTRVSLLSQGYPKSGFTYNMYISNSGLMSTESDKELYTLYDLQDRLGATIRLFDGVQDAKVTVAKGSNEKFALSNTKTIDASASVVVTMKPGATLTESNADAIRNLISRSVKGVNFTNVSVFDAATMEEVGGDSGGDTSKAIQDLTTQVENSIASNIKRVLAKLYGSENVAVSVKGTLDMTKLISENTEYTVPDKVEETERDGLLHHEDFNNENSGSATEGAAGVVGTDANADTPRYTNQNGTNTTTNGYSANAYSRDWLFNVLKEQKEISPGVLKDATVAVVIMTDDRSVQQQDLVNLVADAGGISRLEAAEKITIIRSTPPADTTEEQKTEEVTEEEQQFPLAALIVAIAAAVLLLLILILIILRKKKKKRLAAEAAAAAEAEAAAAAAAAAAAETPAQKRQRDEEMELGAEEDTNASMQHGMRLKQNIGDFIDNNPQVVAKLIQGWLREEEEESSNNGRRRDRSSRK
ncbi:flagellar basal-body MS-ring/collar protein FliF [Oribacterium sp. WCC10]|uniref:flagellar basal-body MS-ring/collar protein FliF n=1 Tax=Oribacterium sp. WCC10 TaxID=1855343 RepID=UPI0008EF3331|nr:flagellar basal-body MS-ring/collar protein FliF [Oribacterium sp. WCC10]SFG25186.1 flagellar M-ring protein FliF [Oribacterium sp. WCC10]